MDIVGESISGIIGDGEGFFFTIEGYDGKDGSEDFFFCDGHLGGDIGKDCGSHEVSTIQSFLSSCAADKEGGSFVVSFLDEVLNFVVLYFRDGGSDVGSIFMGGIDRDLFCTSFGFLASLFVAAFFDKHTRRGIARLPCIFETVCDSSGDGIFVCVMEDEVGPFSSKFEADSLDGIGGSFCDVFPGTCRACETDDVDIGV